MQSGKPLAIIAEDIEGEARGQEQAGHADPAKGAHGEETADGVGRGGG